MKSPVSADLYMKRDSKILFSGTGKSFGPSSPKGSQVNRRPNTANPQRTQMRESARCKNSNL